MAAWSVRVGSRSMATLPHDETPVIASAPQPKNSRIFRNAGRTSPCSPWILAACLTAALAACGGSASESPANPDGGAPDSAADGGADAAADTGADAAADSGADGGLVTCSATQLEALEKKIGGVLDAASADAEITSATNFTLLVERKDGRVLRHSHGSSTENTSYESASTSKWVSAAVILDLVDQGRLSLDAKAHDLIPTFWTEDKVTLSHLLSFRSGFVDAPPCTNSKTADFSDCVNEMFTRNVATAKAPGQEFYYSNNHLQIAGLMAMNATGLSWKAIFDAFKAKTGLFPTSNFDLPSETNPRLAGGMHWTGKEYSDFLGALKKGTLLKAETRRQMHANQRGSAKVGPSPIITAFNEDWSYGFGNWLECPLAKGKNTYNCGEGHRNSSLGDYGGYPFIDFDHDYFGILARQGKLQTAREGVAHFRTVEALVTQWANNQCSP